MPRPECRRHAGALAGLGLPALLLGGMAVAQDPPRLLDLRAEGGDFRATLSNGQVLRGADLVGAVLRFDGGEMRLDSARRDAGVPGAMPTVSADDVWLFGMSIRGTDGAWQPFCEADPDGERLGMVYPGSDVALSLTCSAGGIGKCIRFGYRPWASGPGGASLAPYHAACVNMLRAAYGGGERAWTREGTAIDIYDHIGIQHPANDPTQAFEAGWTATGAVCVAHLRVPEHGDLAALAAAVPRLAGHLGPAACNEARAAEAGARLFNRSRRH
ncbi:ADYC domain-containing protein [Falsiroseomonas sp. HC035]|uniref:ADYC domain-containing protein n=1 Tax=Falsiroseomonas sp. HC035 TaxID=3390999 RepID=UPI003D312182